MKLFQILSVIYLLIALAASFFLINNDNAELFMAITFLTIALFSIHGFVVCVREYRTAYLPLLIAFSLLILTLLFILAIATNIIPVRGWDAIGYVAIAGAVVLVLIGFVLLYALGLWLYARMRK